MTTVEQKLKQALGEMQFQIIVQVHQIEELQSKNEELQKEVDDLKTEIDLPRAG